MVLSAAKPGTSAVALAAVNSVGKLGGAIGPVRDDCAITLQHVKACIL